MVKTLINANLYVVIVMCISVWIGYCPALAADFFSRQTGDWNALTTWSEVSHTGAAAASLPAAGDNVIIGNGHIVTLNVHALVQNVTVQSGVLQYDNVMARTLEITGDLRIEAMGTLTIQPIGAGLPNDLILRGNVVNNGTWTLRPNSAMNTYRGRVIFASPANQTITGSPPVQARFYQIYLNKGSRNAVVDCSISVDASVGGVVNTNAFEFNVPMYGAVGGTWRQSAGTLSLHQYTSVSGTQRIEVQGAIHVVGTAYMLFGQAAMSGTLTLLGGELLFNTTSPDPSRFGLNAGNSIHYQGNSDVSSFVLRQGTVLIAGRLSRTAVNNDALRYEQSGGTLILGAQGNTATRGLFDIDAPLSSVLISGGTILLRNAGSSGAANRLADFTIRGTASASISGGTLQFGDAMSAPNQQFNISVPENLALHNITVWNGVQLNPYSPVQNVRISGDFLVNGTFDGTQTHTVTTATAAASTLTLQGTNNQNQRIAGVGTITLHHLTMNRQGMGAGVAEAQRTFRIAGILDFQEASNLHPQILELGSGVDVNITNPAVNAVQDESDVRSVRTSIASGRLYRALLGAGDYVYPLSSFGSNPNLQISYTPLVYRAESASGLLGAKVFSGSNTILQGAHRQAPASIANYARRVWSVATGGLLGTGRMIVAVPDDIAGTAAALRLARYRPDETTPGNTWLYTDTLTSRPATEADGDWTWIEAAVRVFFSRQSGLWNNAASWSYASHTGDAVPNGDFPSRMADSVIIGGGTNGANNHHIILQNPITIAGTLVGTGINNTGTLECSENAWLGGMRFMLGERSTLRIGSEQGITILPQNAGSIRTTLERIFPANASYVYIGEREQAFGDALPNTVFSLGVEKSPLSILRAGRGIDVWQNLMVESGIFDVGATFHFRNTTTSTAGIMRLGANAVLRIAGTQGFADASTGTVSGYAAYNLDPRSTVELYGIRHILEPLPLPTAGNNNAFGNISVRDAAEVQVWNPLIIWGSVWVRENARLLNFSRDMRVLGSVYNNASFLNYGVVDVGK